MLEFGTDWLDELERAVGDMERGDGDYTIGGDEDSQHIWIWWPPR